MKQSLNRRAFAWYEMLVVLAGIAVVAGIAFMLTPRLSGGSPRTAHQMMNSANVRGIEQSMAIFADSNNNFLPGLDAHGRLLPASAATTGSDTATGAAFSSRLWVLLNGQYIGGDLVINPKDTLARWTSGRSCTTANFSYAGLQLGDDASATTTEHHAGRASAWRSNANAQAILFGDRLLIATDVADAAVRSVWTPTTKGDWKGNIVWGDNHAQFCQTHTGFETRYAPHPATTAPTTQPANLNTNTNDNLFATQAAPGVTETSINSDANAMLIYY